MNKQFKRKIRILICLCLCFLETFGNTIDIFAETKPLYISDITIDNEAALIYAGYTVVSSDINSKSGVDNLYLGYKTTYNKSEALTDVKAMNMYGGFTKFDIQETMTQNANSIAKTSNEIWIAIGEFKENLEGAGEDSPASIALDALNCLYVPETGEALGDYLVSSERTLSDISRIVLMSTSIVMSYITNILMLGLSDNMAEPGAQTWLNRAIDNGTFDLDGMDKGQIKEFYKKYDNEYYQRAYNLLASLKTFAKLYYEALDKFPDGIVDEESFNNATEVVENGELAATLDGDKEADKTADYMYALAAMEFLNSEDEYGYIYYYGADEQSFGQFILDVAETADSDEEAACRMLYPLMVPVSGDAALTEGQEIIMGLTSFAMFVLITGNEENAYVSLREEYDESIENLLAANNGELISVWFGVNTEVYENTNDVYLTGALYRQIASSSRYDIITKIKSEYEINSADIHEKMLVLLNVGMKVLAYGSIPMLVPTVIAAGAYLLGTGCTFLPTILFVCHIIDVLVVVVVVVIIIILIVMYIKYKKEKAKEDEQEYKKPEFKWIEIPRIMYDKGKSEDADEAISYVAVTDIYDNVVDLNQGRNDEVPWVCLYFTRDTDAGSPIMVPADGSSPFIISENSSKPEGYSSVNFFEEIVAANITEGREDGKTSYKYLFMSRSDGGASDQVEGKYISEVILASERSQDGALGDIRRQGYTPIQINLTPDSEIYTYLGYLTTDKVSNAITDLRVAVGSGVDKGGGKITSGINSYGLCGYAGNLMLFQSKLSTAGTPILASGYYERDGVTYSYSGLYVTDNMNDAPEGYEPIILYSGGPAFDFSNCGDWETLEADKEGNLKYGVGSEYILDLSSIHITTLENYLTSTHIETPWSSHMYVYFNPTVKYTEESGTKYLGGLSFFSIPGGVDNMGHDTVRTRYGYYTTFAHGWKSIDTSYIDEMGWSILNDTDLGGYQLGTTTYLCYSETYNPYRAIYDIKYYADTDRNMTGVPFSVSFNSLGYTACDVFAQGGGNLEESRRTMRITHAYRSNMFYEGGGQVDIKQAIEYFYNKNEKVVPEIDNGYWEPDENGTCCPIRCVGLYVTGVDCADIESACPLTVDELFFTDDPDFSYDYEEYTPLRSFTDAYSSYSVNLGGDTIIGESNLYLYIERPDPHPFKPKYIKSVTVGYAKGGTSDSETPFDSTILSLVGHGDGQLYTYNLSGSATPYATKYYNLETYDGEILGLDLDDPYYVEYKIFDNGYAKNAKVAYLWVQYTDYSKDALSDLIIYESKSSTAPDRIDYYYTENQKRPTSAFLCGSGWQVDGSNTYYFLYSINHNGHYITDLKCNSNVFMPEYWTTLTNQRQVSTLNNLYIHTRHNLNDGAFISKFYIGTGKSRDEAIIDLLNQGCQSCVDMDINVNNNEYCEYIGLAYSADYNDAYSGMLLLDAGQNNTITKIENGWNDYTLLTDNLNAAAEDIIVKLYGSKSKALAQINSKSGADGRYVTDIIFGFSGEKTMITLDDWGREVHWNLVTDPKGNSQALCIGAIYELAEYTTSGYGHEYENLWIFPFQKLVGKKYVTHTYVIKTDTGFQSNLYMYVRYSDNSFDDENLISSVFSESGSLIAVITGSVLMVSAVFVFLRKRKKNMINVQ